VEPLATEILARLGGAMGVSASGSAMEERA
jgi:hypothetical protein